MTEQTTTQRKGLPVDIARKADGIVKRLKPSEVVKALLCRTQTQFVLDYIVNNNIEECISNEQIVTSLYCGDTIKYGPTSTISEVKKANPKLATETKEQWETRIKPMVRVLEQLKMILPANPEMITEIANEVPESEANTPTTKLSMKEAKELARQEAKKEAEEKARIQMIDIAKVMVKFNVPMEAIIAKTNLTVEEIEALKGE